MICQAPILDFPKIQAFVFFSAGHPFSSFKPLSPLPNNGASIKKPAMKYFSSIILRRPLVFHLSKPAEDRQQQKGELILPLTRHSKDALCRYSEQSELSAKNISFKFELRNDNLGVRKDHRPSHWNPTCPSKAGMLMV